MSEDNGLNPKLHIRFQPTFTFGNVINVIVLFVVLITGWVKLNDRMDYNEKAIQQQQTVLDKDQEIIQEVQIDQAKTTEIIVFLENKIADEENKKQ